MPNYYPGAVVRPNFNRLFIISNQIERERTGGDRTKPLRTGLQPARTGIETGLVR